MLSLPFDVSHFTKAQNVLHNCLTPPKILLHQMCEYLLHFEYFLIQLLEFYRD